MKSRKLTIRTPDVPMVSALLMRPPLAMACFVFAHGAGADMNHPFMQSIAEKLAAARIATLRFQFPYMEARSKRPDRPAICQAVIRAAVALARRRLPKLPLIAGGKSFGGRMTSQAQAAAPLAHVRGIAFLGYPWHLPRRPSLVRSEHLAGIEIPMLFLQGTRDTMADAKIVKKRVRQCRRTSTLQELVGADHGFHVLKRSGRTDSEVQEELVHAFVRWVTTLA